LGHEGTDNTDSILFIEHQHWWIITREAADKGGDRTRLAPGDV